MSKSVGCVFLKIVEEITGMGLTIKNYCISIMVQMHERRLKRGHARDEWRKWN